MTLLPGINSIGVNWVEISLIKIDEENHIISEASHSVSRGHCDDESEEIVYECVECLVHESSPVNINLMRTVQLSAEYYQGR